MNGPDGLPIGKGQKNKKKPGKKHKSRQAEAPVNARKTQHHDSDEVEAPAKEHENFGVAVPDGPAYKTLYDCKAQPSSYLSFKKGDTLLVTHKEESGWWFGQRPDGSAGGYIPSNYLEERGVAARPPLLIPPPVPSRPILMPDSAWNEDDAEKHILDLSDPEADALNWKPFGSDPAASHAQTVGYATQYLPDLSKAVPIMRPTTGWAYGAILRGDVQEDETPRRADTPRRPTTPPGLSSRSSQDRLADALRVFCLNDPDHDLEETGPASTIRAPSLPKSTTSKPAIAGPSVLVTDPPPGTRSADQTITPATSAGFKFSMLKKAPEPKASAAPSSRFSFPTSQATGFHAKGKQDDVEDQRAAFIFQGTQNKKGVAPFANPKHYDSSTTPESAHNMNEALAEPFTVGYTAPKIQLPKHCPLPPMLPEINRIFDSNRKLLAGLPNGGFRPTNNHSPTGTHKAESKAQVKSAAGLAHLPSAAPAPVARHHPSFPPRAFPYLGDPYQPQQPQSTAADGLNGTWASMFPKPANEGDKRQSPAAAKQPSSFRPKRKSLQQPEIPLEDESVSRSAQKRPRPTSRQPPASRQGGLVEPVLRPKSPARKKETGGRGPKYNGRK